MSTTWLRILVPSAQVVVRDETEAFVNRFGTQLGQGHHVTRTDDGKENMTQIFPLFILGNFEKLIFKPFSIEIQNKSKKVR